MSFFLYGIIILNTALFDTFAYIIGSNFGKTYIVKKISPNKTLEGLVGGLFSSIILGSLIGLSLVHLSFITYVETHSTAPQPLIYRHVFDGRIKSVKAVRVK